MPQLSESIKVDPVRALIFGMTGSAKTTLIGLLAKYEEFRPIYFFDWDLRISSLRAILTEEEMKYIYFDEYRDKTVSGESYISAEFNSRNIANLEKKHGVIFKTLASDSGTFMAQQIMNRVLAADNKASNSNPQLQHYLSLQSLQAELIGRLAFTGRHFFFTCHEDTQKDEVLGKIWKNVDLNGKSANRIPGYFNEVWHTELKLVPGGDPKYVVRTRSDAVYNCRTSYKQLLTVEEQGDIWPKILKSMK